MRWIESPSGTTPSMPAAAGGSLDVSSGSEHRALWPDEETGLTQKLGDLRLCHRDPVEALDGEPAAAVGSHPVCERRKRRLEPRRLGITERHERATTPLDEEHCFTAEEDDLRSGDPCGAGAGAARPRQRRPVRLGRIRGCQDQGRVIIEAPKLAESLNSSRKCELRTSEPFHEVPASTCADRLERS